MAEQKSSNRFSKLNFEKVRSHYITMFKKKSLGQNFLKSKSAILKMVEVSDAKKGDMVLEIGPGLGVLTEALLDTEAKVVAVEKDYQLIPILEEKFAKEISSGQLELIYGDILETEIPNPDNVGECKSFLSPRRRGAGLVNDPTEGRDLDKSKPRTALKVAGLFGEAQETFSKPNCPDLELQNYKLVTNIPYYITGQIIRKFLETENQPSSMTLLVQKEVADRIVAKDGKESLLSISVKAYGSPKYIQTVRRGSFDPAPKVDSAIIHIADISRKNFQKISEENFFRLIHAGFAHKRKQLLPNLASLYPKDALTNTFEGLKIPLQFRAENLHLTKWLELCKELH